MFKFFVGKLKPYLSSLRRRLGLFVFFCFTLNLPVSAYSLTLSTGEFLPYTSESLKMGGPLSQIVIAALAKSNHQVELLFTPWKRTYKLAENNRVDGSFPWSVKAERQLHFLYSKPLFIFEHRAFSLSGTEVNLAKTAAKGSINLCRPQGYTLHGLAEELIATGVAQHFVPPDVENCFEMLKIGRVDIVVVDRLEGIEMIGKLFSNPDEVKMLDKVIHKYSNHFIISKQHPQANALIKDFNKGLDQMMETGEYQTILFDELGL